MPKRPASLETLQVALELLRRIPKGRTVTAPQLKQLLAGSGFERNIRTIERQLETLTLSGYFGIERDETSKPYRYRWNALAKGFSLPALTAQECLLLALAEQQLKQLLPPRLMKSMAAFFSQAMNQLDEQATARQEREWLKKVRVVSTSQPLLPPKVDEQVFEQVCNALYGDQWLIIEYLNAAGEEKKSRVMPLGLVQQGPRMYLVCRFEGYENERNLALHRIKAAKASSFTFRRPPKFDLKQYDDNGRLGYGNGELITLSFWIEKDYGLHLLESPLSKDQQVCEGKKHYKINATVVDSAMLDWWLRGFGKAVSRISKHHV
ncbi:MAG TPA: WYL domain-containing protein [Acidobacteriaceae bacterium]|nr:WYL domain-containing protein [Acidobacteriaceae bacterium]